MDDDKWKHLQRMTNAGKPILVDRGWCNEQGLLQPIKLQRWFSGENPFVVHCLSCERECVLVGTRGSRHFGTWVALNEVPGNPAAAGRALTNATPHTRCDLAETNIANGKKPHAKR